MPRFITNSCLSCGVCITKCPVSSIFEGTKTIFVINADVCIDCGTCQANCPNGAIAVRNIHQSATTTTLRG